MEAVIEDIKNNIYTQLENSIENTDTVLSICNLVESVDQHHIDNTNCLLQNWETDIDELSEKYKESKIKIENYKNELIKQEKRNKQFNESFKLFMIIRQAINRLFNNLWDKNENEINEKQPDFNDLAIKTDILTRKDLVNKPVYKGIKYALCAIHKIHGNTPIELCNFYIIMNEKLHPKSETDYIVTQTINSLEEIIKKGELPPYFSEMGLNIQTLEQLKQLV